MEEVKKERFPNVVSVTHDGLKYEIDVDAELAVDPQNLTEAFTRQPGQYAWFATVHAAALHMVEKAKLRLDVTKSRAAAELRESLNERGKPYSETAISSILDGDKEVVTTVEKLLEAKRQESILRALREAFAHRRDMLVQMGANERLEKSGY